MISFENTVEIRRGIPEVFSYIADLENIPRWNYAIETTSQLTSGPVGVGTRYLQRRRLPRETEETIEIVEHRPPHLLVLEGMLGSFAARSAYRFEPVEVGTRLTNSMELRPTGVARLVAPLAGRQIEKAVAVNFDAVRRILEHVT